MRKLTYCVLCGGSLRHQTDQLSDALEHLDEGGSVYERLGHSTGVKIDFTDELLAALKWALGCGEFWPGPDSDMKRAAEELIKRVDQYNADVRKAIEGNL